MTKLETRRRSDFPSSFDLDGIEEAQRAALWSRAARTFFPGLTVRDLQSNPTSGTMQGTPFGSGHLWNILSPQLQVSYEPANNLPVSDQTFSLMLQLEGSTVAMQNKRSCSLRRHDFCVIDGLSPFTLEVRSPNSHVAFLQMPRHAILSRHPFLANQTAETFDAQDSGSELLRNLLLNVLCSVPFLRNEQRELALSAITQLLGAPVPSAEYANEISWRARHALAYIESQFTDATLSSVRVAKDQGISRRRLDAILLKTAGISLAAQIWARRLSQAANDLVDPQHAHMTVTRIAFAVGFEDSAHFTRAFKRRYHMTPRDWRNQARKAAASALL